MAMRLIVLCVFAATLSCGSHSSCSGTPTLEMYDSCLSHTSMLQLRVAEELSVAAFSFCGGGQRAQVTHWAFMHGFLRARGDASIRNVWRDTVVGSNSGGGWFVASVLYDADVQGSLENSSRAMFEDLVRRKYEAYVRNMYGSRAVDIEIPSEPLPAASAFVGYPAVEGATFIETHYFSQNNGWKKLLEALYKDFDAAHASSFHFDWVTTNVVLAQPQAFSEGAIEIIPRFYGGGQKDCRTMAPDGCESPKDACVISDECKHCSSTSGQCHLSLDNPYKFLPTFMTNTYDRTSVPQRRVYIPLIDNATSLNIAATVDGVSTPVNASIDVKEIHMSILNSADSPSVYGGPSSAFFGMNRAKGCLPGLDLSSPSGLGSLFNDVLPAWKTSELSKVDVGLTMADGVLLDDTGILAAIHSLQGTSQAQGQRLIVAHMDYEHEVYYQGLFAGGNRSAIVFGPTCRPRVEIFAGAPSSEPLAKTKSGLTDVWMDEVTTMSNEEAGILEGTSLRIITFSTGRACSDKLVSMLVGVNLRSAKDYAACALKISDEIHEAMQLQVVQDALRRR